MQKQTNRNTVAQKSTKWSCSTPLEHQQSSHLPILGHWACMCNDRGYIHSHSASLLFCCCQIYCLVTWESCMYKWTAGRRTCNLLSLMLNHHTNTSSLYTQTRNQNHCLLWGTAIPAGPITHYHKNTLAYLYTLFRNLLIRIANRAIYFIQTKIVFRDFYNGNYFPSLSWAFKTEGKSSILKYFPGGMG